MARGVLNPKLQVLNPTPETLQVLRVIVRDFTTSEITQTSPIASSANEIRVTLLGSQDFSPEVRNPQP